MGNIVWDDEQPQAAGITWDDEPAPSGITWDDEQPGLTPDLQAFEQVEQQKDERLRMLLQVFDQAPSKQAGVLRLAKESGAEPAVIESNYEEFRRTWEVAQKDIRRWRRENPGLAYLALEHPELGSAVQQDEQLSVLSRALNAALDVRQWLGKHTGADWLEDNLGVEVGPTAAIDIPTKLVGKAMDAISGKRETAAQAREGERVVPRQQSLVQTEESDRIKDEGDWFDRAMVPFLRFGETWKGLEVSKRQFELMSKRAAGLDTYDDEMELMRLKREALPKDYGEGAIGQVFTDVATALASQASIWASAGVGAGVAAGVAGGATLAVTKSPRAALSVAGKAAALGRRVGMSVGSFELEAGSAYGELMEMKAEDGTPISNELATGAAILYGVLAAGVEVASEEQKLRALGPIGKAILKGERGVALKELLQDPRARELMMKGGRKWLAFVSGRAAKEWGKSAVGEGLEEGIQQATQDAVAYFAKSWAGGAWQKEGVDLGEVWRAAEKGAIGTGGIGVLSAAVNVHTTMLSRDEAVRSGKLVAAMAGAAGSGSEVVQLASPAIATMVARETAKTSQPLTHLYVDSAPFVRFFQEKGLDAEQAAVELLGENGPRMLQEALATGERLEVPVELYLKKWGASEAANALAGDTSTTRDLPTPRQLEALPDEVASLSKKLKDDDAETLGEAEFIEAIEAQAASTEAYGKGKGRQAAQLFRAFISTAAAKFGKGASELFRDYAILISENKPQQAEEDASFEFGENLSAEQAKAAKLIQRMRPDNRAKAQAWFDYATGKTETRPTDITDQMKLDLARYGVVDPLGVDFNEQSRDLAKPLGGKKLRGEEPEELRRLRLMNKGVDLPYGYIPGGRLKQDTAQPSSLDAGTGQAQIAGEASGAALKARPSGSSTGRTAPEASTLSSIRETGAPVRDDGTLNAGETVMRLYQTRDWRSWVERFRANSAVQKTYTPGELDAFEQGLEATAAIFGDFSMLGEEGKGTPLRGNTDPLFKKTWDITTLCPRQDRYVSTITAVEHKLGRILNPFERHLVGVMLREDGTKPACWFCYGQAGRNAYDFAVVKATDIATKYVELRKRKAKPTPADMEAVFSGEGYNWNPDGRWRAFLDANWKHLEGEGALDAVRLRDIARGLADAQTSFEKELKRAVKGAAQGATRANAPKPWASLRDHFLRNLKPDDVQRFNAIAGLRMNSQTDFRPWHVLEVAEGLAQLRAVKSMLHVYTKEADFLRVFGGTGIKFNLSISYATDEKGAILREKGRAKLDDVRGMAAKDVDLYRKKHPRDVGGMLVALNDEQLLEGLADERVDMIIPYHAGSVPKSVDKFEGAFDYSSEQHEDWGELTKGDIKSVKLSNGKTVKVVVGQPITREHHFNDKKLYLELCDKLGIEPRFARFKGHDNYMKLVRDVAREPSNQQVVDPRAIDWKAASEIVDRWVKAGGEKADTEADPKLVAYVLGRIKANDWPQGVVTPEGQDVAIEDTLYGDTKEQGVEADRLHQGDDADARGYTDFLQKGTKRIAAIFLNPSADFSTLLHEGGHVFLDALHHLAQRPDAPEAVRQHMADALKTLGVERWEDLTREHHEKWARQFEAYLLEGKAPSASLEGVFQSFKLWLVKVYRSLAGLGEEPVNEAFRSVFDRLLATDEEIAATKRRMGLSEPLFRSPAEAGMTPEQWEAYQKAREELHSKATRAVELRAMKDRLRSTEAWWKELEKEERKAAEQEFEALPARIARRFLREQDIKLDRSKVEAAVGKEGVKRVNVSKKGGEDPDELATILNFPSGKALLEALVALPEKEKWVADTVAERMRAKHPDVLQDRDQLREAAEKGLHGDATVSWLMKELAALARRAGSTNAPPPREAYVQAAKRIVEAKTLQRLDAGAALRTERAAADRAMKAAAKGDFAQALLAKQQQLLQVLVHRELSEAREEREKFLALAGDLSKETFRRRIRKARPVYVDGLDVLLEAFGLKEPQEGRTLPALTEVAAAMLADGSQPVFDVDAVAALVAKHPAWRDLTVEQMRQVDAALRNLKGVASTIATAIVDGKRLDKEEVAGELVGEAMKNLPSLGPEREVPDSVLEAVSKAAQKADGNLLRLTTVAKWLGGNSLDSMWYRAIVKPLQKAKHDEADLLRSTIEPLLKAFEAMPRRFDEAVDGKKLFPGHRTDLEPPTRRYELLMMALNSGNAGNLQRLLDGRGILQQQLSAALELLTKEEWDWVQSVWDACESLWPAMAELEQRDAGLAPEKVPAIPVKTKFGLYRGGYFPAVYAQVEQAGERQAVNAVADVLDQSYTRPSTPHGHLKARVEKFAGAISLNPNIIVRHLAKAAHDITHREALKSVAGLLLHKDVRAAMRERVGPGRQEQFLQWLKDIGQLGARDAGAHASALSSAFSSAKSNLVMSVMGYSIRTAMGDFANLATAIPGSDLKARYWAQGMAEAAASPLESVRLTGEKSGELRFRRMEVQRKLNWATKRMLDRGATAWLRTKGPLGFLREHAFDVFEWVDKFTTTPLWLGAYRQALDEGKPEEAAVTFADDVINRLFPSHSPVDMAPILRDQGVIGKSLFFYGYFSVTYNVLRDIAHPLHTAEDMAESAKRAPVVAARALAFVMSYGLLAELLSGRGPDEDEEWADWLLRKMLLSAVLPVPLVGDLASTLIEGRGRRPGRDASGMLDTLGRDIGTLLDGDAEDHKRLEALLRSLGIVVGLPASAPIRASRYLRSVAEGEAEVGPVDTPAGLAGY